MGKNDTQTDRSYGNSSWEQRKVFRTRQGEGYFPEGCDFGRKNTVGCHVLLFGPCPDHYHPDRHKRTHVLRCTLVVGTEIGGVGDERNVVFPKFRIISSLHAAAAVCCSLVSKRCLFMASYLFLAAFPLSTPLRTAPSLLGQL